MILTRTLEADLLELTKYFPVIGVVGPRQCGKTTLVKQIAPDLEDDFIYLDLERSSDLDKLQDAELFLTHQKDKCVILDEIQRLPELFPLIRSLVDDDRERLRYILLGSASPKLLRQSSESLAGRIAYIELSPFNYLEIEAHKSLNEHHFFGGFPNSILASSHKAAQLWMNNFIRSYIERDLPALGFPASTNTLRKLLEMIAWSSGNLLNYANLSKSLGVSNHTLKSYIDLLEDAFIIRRLQPFSFNQKKRLVKSPKIYIRDTGILHRLLRLNSFDQLMGHPILGNSWESYVLEQIDSLKSDDIDLYFYRTSAGAEVDIVLVKALKAIATIEIKYSTKVSAERGMMNCIADLETDNNFIITPISDDYPVRNNVQVCNIEVFLKKYLPLF